MTLPETIDAPTPTLDVLRNWLYRGGERGDSIIYWRGHLACDRMRVDNIDGRLLYRIMYPAHAIGKLMYKAYANDRVTLVQRKVEPFDYEYIAIIK